LYLSHTGYQATSQTQRIHLPLPFPLQHWASFSSISHRGRHPLPPRKNYPGHKLYLIRRIPHPTRPHQREPLAGKICTSSPDSMRTLRSPSHTNLWYLHFSHCGNTLLSAVSAAQSNICQGTLGQKILQCRKIYFCCLPGSFRRTLLTFRTQTTLRNMHKAWVFKQESRTTYSSRKQKVLMLGRGLTGTLMEGVCQD